MIIQDIKSILLRTLQQVIACPKVALPLHVCQLDQSPRSIPFVAFTFDSIQTSIILSIYFKTMCVSGRHITINECIIKKSEQVDIAEKYDQKERINVNQLSKV